MQFGESVKSVYRYRVPDRKEDSLLVANEKMLALCAKIDRVWHVF